MRTYFILCFILFSNLILSQNTLSFEYVVKYKMSYNISSQNTSKQEEIFYLFINDKESFYISENLLAKDSIIVTDQIFSYDLSKLMKYRTYFVDRIYFNSYMKNQISFIKYNSNYFSFNNENTKLNWTVTNEKKTIGNITCSSATIESLGRKWKAYYADSYPFPYGPHRFQGLPGLIISIEDSESIYKFELIELKRKKTVYTLPRISKKVDKEDYFKLLKDLHFSSKVFDKFTVPDDPSLKQKMRTAFEKNVKRINNYPIEKDMRYIFE